MAKKVDVTINFFIVFLPFFSVLGPTDVFGHKTMRKCAMKGSYKGVILLVLAIYTRAAYETILLVCLGYIKK